MPVSYSPIGSGKKTFSGKTIKEAQQKASDAGFGKSSSKSKSKSTPIYFEGDPDKIYQARTEDVGKSGKSYLIRTVPKSEQVARQQSIASNKPTYYISSGGNKVTVSKALYDKVQKDNAVLNTTKTAPAITLTSQGSRYTDSGSLISDVRKSQAKANAFAYLAPAEKWIAERVGSKEKVYNRIVKTKLKLAKESDFFTQQRKKYYNIDYFGQQTGSGEYLKSLPYRAKELTTEFKIGAFNMASAPVETAALVLIGKAVPTSAASSPFAATSGAGVGAVLGYSAYRSPKDTAKGLARTAGELSVIGSVSALDKAATTKIKQIAIRKELKVIGQGGATKSYTTSAGKTFQETRSASRVIGKKTDYTVKSRVTQEIGSPQNNIKIGKAKGSIQVIDTKTKGIVSKGSVDVRSFYNTQQQRTLSAIKLNQAGAKSTYIDYTRYKNLKGGYQSEVGILYKTKNLKVSNLYKGKAVQVSKATTQEIFSRGIYTESGALQGTQSRSFFIKGGVSRAKGVEKFFKFDFVNQAKANPISSSATSSGSTNLLSKTVTTSKGSLVMQQSLAKEVVIKNIIGQGTTQKIIPVSFNPKPKTITKQSTTSPPDYKQKIETFSYIPIQESKTNILSRIKTSQKTSSLIDTSSIIKPSQIVTPIQSIATTQQERYIQKEPSTIPQDLINPTVTAPSFAITPNRFLGGAGSFGLPFLEFGGNKRASKKVKFKSKYTPSLEAEIFNIKGKGSRFAEISGLGIRKITRTGGI